MKTKYKTMKLRFNKLLVLLNFFIIITLFSSCSKEPKPKRPNILFAIADDASLTFGAYGVNWLKTPAFDYVARNGVLFMNAYTPNAKCAPSRACIITGRNSWQLGAAANHFAYFPAKYKTYPEALAAHGYYVGFTGKPWAPGDPGYVNGKKRNLVGKPFQKIKDDPPTQYISDDNYAANFRQFLDKRPKDKPFCFWYGSHEPHRGFAWDSGIKKGKLKPSSIPHDQIPSFFPDNDTVRTDLVDYAFETEYFDKHLQRMLNMLKERGLLDNTIVVVTSDNGMSFPRIKGQEYMFSNHLPLAIMWKDGVKNPGRKVTDFVSFIDFAPTFLQLAGITQKESGMQPITGRSLTDILYSADSGKVTSYRNYVLIGKERHDVGRPHDWGYPIRGIITKNYLYIHNFKTDRWPAGNPETGYLNCDGSPTKTWILNHRNDPRDRIYWQLSFGKRPADELYNINKDPNCMENFLTAKGGNVNLIVSQNEEKSYKDIANELQDKLYSELKKQMDPRMFGEGYIFDEYPYSGSDREIYDRVKNGEIKPSQIGYDKSHPYNGRKQKGPKRYAEWVNSTDVESAQPLKRLQKH